MNSRFGSFAVQMAVAIVICGGFFYPSNGVAAVLESFLEPNKRIDIVPANRDLIQQVHVKEGELVKKGQLLVTLDLTVLNAQRKTAKILAETHGKIDSAKILVEMRKDQLENLKRVKATGHVRPKELEKSKADYAIASANLLTARENRRIRQAELKQIEAQIAVKKIKSPVDGIISRIYKTEGELVGLNDVDAIVTVLQGLPLHAVFHIPYGFMGDLDVGHEMLLEVTGFGEAVRGFVLYVSPLVSPESGTVRVKVGFSEDFRAKSGIRCSVDTDQFAEN